MLYDSLLRLCFAHCFLCVLLSVCDVSAQGSVLYLFCLIVWYVNASRTVLNVFRKVFSHASVSRIVLNVFCMITWYVSASSIVWNVFCKIFCYVSVLRTVLNVFCFIVSHVSSSYTVLRLVSALRTFLYVSFMVVW